MRAFWTWHSCLCTLCLILNKVSVSYCESTVSIVGAGSSFPADVYSEAPFAYKFIKPEVLVSYVPLASKPGKCHIPSHPKNCRADDNRSPIHIDFAASESLLSSSDYAAFPDLQMYPTVAGAVVPIYNLKNVTDLVLSRKALAQIFRREIQVWDDPRIRETNPQFDSWRIPKGQPIALAVRPDTWGAAHIFVKSLSSFDEAFRHQMDASPNSSWTVSSLDGNGALCMHVLAKPYTLSYAPFGLARDLGVSMAGLFNGNAVVTPSTTSIEYALLEKGSAFGNTGEDPRRLTCDIHNGQLPQAWPIVG